MGFYDRYILPPLINTVMGAKPFTYQRRKVVPRAEGEVLVFGMGAGQTTRSYATRAYLVEYAGGGAKITVAMVGDGRHTDIQLINIRKLTPPPAIVTLGRPDMHVWSEFERW